LVPGRRLRLLALVIFSFLGGLAEAASLFLLARIAFALVNPGKDVSTAVGPVGSLSLSVGGLIVLAAVLVAVRFVLQLITLKIQTDLYGEVLEVTRVEIVHDYLSASWAAQADDREGRLQELVGNFGSSVAGQMGAVAGVLVAGFSLIAMLSTALFANALGTLAVAAAGLILIVVLRPFRKAIRRRSNANARIGLELGTAVTETASMAQEIHIFGVQGAVQDDLARLTRQSRRAAQRFQILHGALPAFYQAAALMIVIGGVGLVYLLGGSRLASLGAVLLIGVRSLSYAQSLQQSLQALHVGAPFIETVEEERRRYQGAVVQAGDRPLPSVESLEFKDVSYAYDGTRFALRGFSFSARRGEIIGIVGPSGSGKSTLVQLMLRLREPGAGSIVVNGVDAHEFSLEAWVHRVVFVSQESHLYAGSVSDNIRFFRDGVDQDEIEEAARRAHIHDEITRWPEQYETEVGERGRKLSGGQRQRLTIARALVGNPDVVVLDEPTSSLDVHSESAIRATLLELGKQAIVFVIAHRLSTLDICGRIMVIQDGQLRGFDEPARLEASSTFYREALELSGLRPTAVVAGGTDGDN